MKKIDCFDIYCDAAHYDAMNGSFDEDIAFYQRVIHRNPEGTILELACGTGRLSCRLAQQGYSVTGLDVSVPMIARARRNAEAKNLNIEWILADCRQFSLSKKFSFIIFPFNSIAHIHDQVSVQRCFQSVKEHLVDEGLFLIDIYNPDLRYLIRNPNEKFPVAQYRDPSDDKKIYVEESSNYDASLQINFLKWYYTKEDEIMWVKDLNMRMFFPQELDALLQYNGFKIERKYGDYHGSPFSSHSPKQLFVAAKA